MRTLVLISCCGLLACGGDDPPANVAGDYTINVTNRENACMLMNWTAGETVSAVPLVITQDGAEITADLGGLSGVWYDLVIGGSTFQGHVDGNRLHLTLHGTRAYTDGACTGTITVEGEAVLTGDALDGDLVYAFDTNGSPECGDRATCRNRQQFNGTRPPTE